MDDKKDQWDPDVETCWIDIQAIGFGIRLYACFSRNFFGPVGLAWTSDKGGEGGTRIASVLWIYVLPYTRRRGIGHLLLKKIRSRNDVVMTGTGSDDGGLALMKAEGFRYLKSVSQWFIKGIGSGQKKK